MNVNIRSIFLALIASGLAAAAQAQRAHELVTINQAMETPAASVVLPMNATSSLVMPACGGCPPKSFPATAATKYFVNKAEVSVEELRSAVANQPNLMLTVKYTVKTGALVSVTADIEAPRTAPRR